MTPSVREIDEETVAAYQADGVVMLRGVFAGWVEPLRAGIAALMADPSPLERTVKPADGCGAVLTGYLQLAAHPRVQVVRARPAWRGDRGCVDALAHRAFFHDHVFVKRAGSSRTPWHHDLTITASRASQS